ncbi:MAG TPA: sugar phosphate isomerase/epimerase family protein [Ktedonobacterales bacterium]
MSEAIFRLSAFGDEIADDLAAQLDTLAEQRIEFIEVRAAWGKNVLDLTDEELRAARKLLDARGFGVSAIGSPIGKSSLAQPRAFEQRRLERAIHAADTLGARLIRVFSFFVPQGGVDDSVERETLARLRLLTVEAERARLTLVHENEKDIFGDTAERCRLLLSAIGSPALRQAFDPANFVQVGVHPMRDAWPLLAAYTTHVHIKDARFSDGAVYPPGQGDGALGELLEALAHTGYQGYLTLEPHLQFAGPAGGYSGPEGMRVASQALRALLRSCQTPIIVR